MCQILKISYNGGNLVVEVSASRDLTNHMFELYLFDFRTGEYGSKAYIRQVITPKAYQDGGIYRFKHPIPSNCKIKCAVVDGEEVLVSRERFIGDRYKISIGMEKSEIGYLYTVKADLDISRKLIFYKSPVSKTKIHLPADIIVGETLMFTIKGDDFRPKFECLPEFVDCFSIEG